MGSEPTKLQIGLAGHIRGRLTSICPRTAKSHGQVEVSALAFGKFVVSTDALAAKSSTLAENYSRRSCLDYDLTQPTQPIEVPANRGAYPSRFVADAADRSARWPSEIVIDLLI